MNLDTTISIPQEELVAHLRAFYPGRQIGTCHDYGGEGHGAGVVLGDNDLAFIHFDDGTWGETGWCVETFNVIELDPEVFPCDNLGAALAKLNKVITEFK